MSDVPGKEEVEKVAAKLTKPQRTALWNLRPNGRDTFVGGWQRAPHDGWRRAGQACTNLCVKGLAEKDVEDFSVLYRLTPLGLAVRAHLQEKKP